MESTCSLPSFHCELTRATVRQDLSWESESYDSILQIVVAKLRPRS
jgi:hypothetical protein